MTTLVTKPEIIFSAGDYDDGMYEIIKLSADDYCVRRTSRAWSVWFTKRTYMVLDRKGTDLTYDGLTRDTTITNSLERCHYIINANLTLANLV